MTEQRLRIALQKKGRLADDSYALLKKCGLRFAIRGGGLLARVKNMPIDLLLVRDDDIPSFVASGAADIGIVGENVLVEEQLSAKTPLDASIDMRLGFSRCKLCLAASDNSGIASAEQLEGTTIATTYPGVLGQYLADKKIDANMVEMKGAVELAPSIGSQRKLSTLCSTRQNRRSTPLQKFCQDPMPQQLFPSQANLFLYKRSAQKMYFGKRWKTSKPSARAAFLCCQLKR